MDMSVGYIQVVRGMSKEAFIKKYIRGYVQWVCPRVVPMEYVHVLGQGICRRGYVRGHVKGICTRIYFHGYVQGCISKGVLQKEYFQRINPRDMSKWVCPRVMSKWYEVCPKRLL